MKTSNRSFNIIGLGSVLALAFSLTATAAFAGRQPTPWEVKQAEAANKNPVDAAMTCTQCKTETITEKRGEWPNGRGSVYYAKVGTQHSCSNCGGTISDVKGQVKNEMNQNCKVCGPESSNCCTKAINSKS
jgi:hypothetical protein